MLRTGAVLDALGPDYESPIELEGGDRVWALPRRGAAVDSQRVVHLLNRDYDRASDSFSEKDGMVLRVHWPEDTNPPTRVIWSAPASADQSLEFQTDNRWISIEVPRLDYWGIVAME